MKLKRSWIAIVLTAAAACAALALQNSAQHEVLFEKARFTMETKGDLKGAIELFDEIIKKYPNMRDYAAKSLYFIGVCYEKLGSAEAPKAFEQLLSEYPDQREITTEARTRLAALTKPADDSGITMRQVWVSSAANDPGTPSPDGRFLLYVDWDSGGNVAIRELATSQTRLLTSTATGREHFALNPRMSPDGKWVAYQWQNEELTYDLRLVGIDGGSPRILYADRNYEVYPAAWSPDGRQIAVRRYILKKAAKGGTIKTEIALVDVASGSIRVLKSLEKPCATRISFSDDGRYLVYDFPSDKDSGRYDISLLALEGSREVPLVRHPANDRLLGWMPGTRALIFRSDRSDTYDLYILHVSDDGSQGAPVAIKRGIGEIDSLGFVNDGSFYFSLYTRSASLRVAPFDLASGRMQLEAGEAYRGSNMQPQWSPDGNYLAFMTEQNKPAGPGFPARRLRFRNMRTGNIQEIAGHLNVDSFCWFSNTRAILVDGHDTNKEGKDGIYEVEFPSGNAKLLWELTAEPRPRLLWTDGKTVIYPKGGTIVVRDLATRRERELFNFKQTGGRPDLSVSPNGEHLAIVTGRSRLQMIPVAGGAPREPVTLKDPQSIQGPFAWTPDGKSLLFQVAEGQGSYSLHRMNAEGGDSEKLWESKDLIAGSVSIHPDGKRIAISTLTQVTEIWVMENLRQLVK